MQYPIEGRKKPISANNRVGIRDSSQNPTAIMVLKKNRKRDIRTSGEKALKERWYESWNILMSSCSLVSLMPVKEFGFSLSLFCSDAIKDTVFSRNKGIFITSPDVLSLRKPGIPGILMY